MMDNDATLGQLSRQFIAQYWHMPGQCHQTDLVLHNHRSQRVLSGLFATRFHRQIAIWNPVLRGDPGHSLMIGDDANHINPKCVLSPAVKQIP
jgi:hypothetical protein